MSAASAPKPDDVPAPATDADGWALLEGLRRRLDDQATHGRKTQAQVTQLADSIAALVAQQRRRSLWLNVNSFVAYVVFTILCGAGFFLVYRSRAHELTQDRDRAVAERDAAVRRADEGTVRAVARESAETKAWEIYQLLEAGKRGDAVGKLDALRDQPLSKTERAVLAARVHDTQVMEVDAALKSAVGSFKAGRPGEAVKPLEAALSSEGSGPRAATIHYYLGVAYAKTDLASSTAHLQAAIAGDVDQEDARFQLASVLDRSGAFGAARVEYDRFATAHPQSPLAVFAMRRSATLARLPAVMPPAAQPGPAPAQPGVAPAQPGVAPAQPGVAPAQAGVVRGASSSVVPAPGGAPGPGGAPNPGIAPSPGATPGPAGGAPGPGGVRPGAVAPAGAAHPGVIVPGSPVGAAPRPGVAAPIAPPAAAQRPGVAAPPAAAARPGVTAPVAVPRPGVVAPAPGAAPHPGVGAPSKPASDDAEAAAKPIPAEPAGQ